MYGQMDGWINGLIYGLSDVWMDGWTNVYGYCYCYGYVNKYGYGYVSPRGAWKARLSGLDSKIIPAWSLKNGEVFHKGCVDRPSVLFQILSQYRYNNNLAYFFLNTKLRTESVQESLTGRDQGRNGSSFQRMAPFPCCTRPAEEIDYYTPNTRTKKQNTAWWHEEWELYLSH